LEGGVCGGAGNVGTAVYASQQQKYYHIYLTYIVLVFGVTHIHWRRIQVQVEVLQASQIKHGRV